MSFCTHCRSICSSGCQTPDAGRVQNNLQPAKGLQSPPCSLPLPTHFSRDEKQLHAAYTSKGVQDLSSPPLTTSGPAAPPGQQLRVPPAGRPEAGTAVPGSADKARPRRGQSRSRGATRRGGAGRGCPGAGVAGTIKSRVPGGSGAVRSVQLRSWRSDGPDLLGARSMDGSMDGLDLSSGILIEFADNGSEEIGSADYGDYGEPCFQHENADFNRIFLPTIYSIIFLTGIIGNGLVIIVMGYQKKQRSMTDKYRLHLSVADLLFVITLPFWSVDAAISWYFGNVLCKAVHVIYTVNLYSSVLILAFISLDRYLAIVHATNSQRPRKLLAEKIVYVGVWLPAVLLTVPDIIFASTSEVEGRYLCDRMYPHDNWLISFRFQHILVGLVLPGLIILTCYCIIISKLSHSKGHQKRKALKTTVILILTFFACWLPYYIGISIDTFILLGVIRHRCSLDTIVHKWISITEALAFFHCCLNPILYAFLGAKFKTSAQNALTSVSRGSSLKILSKSKRGGHSSVSTESESSSFHSS